MFELIVKLFDLDVFLMASAMCTTDCSVPEWDHEALDGIRPFV
jgi:hypothetical protein